MKIFQYYSDIMLLLFYTSISRTSQNANLLWLYLIDLLSVYPWMLWLTFPTNSSITVLLLNPVCQVEMNCWPQVSMEQYCRWIATRWFRKFVSNFSCSPVVAMANFYHFVLTSKVYLMAESERGLGFYSFNILMYGQALVSVNINLSQCKPTQPAAVSQKVRSPLCSSDSLRVLALHAV